MFRALQGSGGTSAIPDLGIEAADAPPQVADPATSTPGQPQSPVPAGENENTPLAEPAEEATIASAGEVPDPGIAPVIAQSFITAREARNR